jgi:hypothetical protein
MENVRILYERLVYFVTIRYNILPLGIVCVYLVYFSRFCMFGPRKIWQPCTEGKEAGEKGEAYLDLITPVV